MANKKISFKRVISIFHSFKYFDFCTDKNLFFYSFITTTYIDEIRKVIHEVLVYCRIRCLETQDIFVSCFQCLQLRLLILGLPLNRMKSSLHVSSINFC